MRERFLNLRACWLAALATGVVTAAPAQTVIHGSMTFNSRIIEPYQSEIETASKQKLTVVANKSSLGLLALLEKRADLAMISAPLEGEVALLQKDRSDLPYGRLRNFEISRTRIAFAVHPTNPIRVADRETIKRVLMGALKNWRGLGGPDLPIRVVMVREGGGVQASVEAELLAGKHIQAENPIRVHISSQVVKMVAQEAGALGLAQLGVLRKSKLPELSLDPPVIQVLNLVTLDEPSPAVQAIIDSARQVAAAKLDR